MKANNNSTPSSRPAQPNPPEENDAFLSYATILLSGSDSRQAEGSSPAPPLPLMQSGKGATNREELLAIIDGALVIISDSYSSDFIGDANSLYVSNNCSRRQ
jgi:hypothetical protein